MGVNITVCVCVRERQGGKICLCEVANCCLAASVWPECTQVNVSRSEHCERICKIVLRFGNSAAAVSTFNVRLCLRVNLCSAGTETAKKLVNVVSHSPLVGQLRQLVSNFHDASVLLAALLTGSTPPELQKHRGISSCKELLNANYPNMTPCVTLVCKSEKWNHTEGLKPNTNTAHGCGLPCTCPGLPLERAKSFRQQGQGGKPQHCRFITSACLSFPLESQFQPLRRRGEAERKGGRQRRWWAWWGGEWLGTSACLPTQLGRMSWLSQYWVWDGCLEKEDGDRSPVRKTGWNRKSKHVNQSVNLCNTQERNLKHGWMQANLIKSFSYTLKTCLKVCQRHESMLKQK